MLLNFDPREYFLNLIDEVFKPIADKHNDKFIGTEADKKFFTFYETKYISTTITKYDIIQKEEGWFKKKINSYMVLQINGNEARWLLKQINKKKRITVLKEINSGILFHFKKDKI